MYLRRKQMSIDEVVGWYEKNVNYKITKAFLNSLVKLGIINVDVDIELLNLFLLIREDDEFKKKDGLYLVKDNRKELIDSYDIDTIVAKNKEKNNIATNNIKKDVKKFKIEKIGGKSFKLVKI